MGGARGHDRKRDRLGSYFFLRALQRVKHLSMQAAHRSRGHRVRGIFRDHLHLWIIDHPRQRLAKFLQVFVGQRANIECCLRGRRDHVRLDPTLEHGGND